MRKKLHIGLPDWDEDRKTSVVILLTHVEHTPDSKAYLMSSIYALQKVSVK